MDGWMDERRDGKKRRMDDLLGNFVHRIDNSLEEFLGGQQQFVFVDCAFTRFHLMGINLTRKKERITNKGYERETCIHGCIDV